MESIFVDIQYEIMTPTYAPFDAADYLDNAAIIAEHLAAATQDFDRSVFLAALGDVLRAQSLAQGRSTRPSSNGTYGHTPVRGALVREDVSRKASIRTGGACE